eukprot:COSAG02_NODE_1872_length_10579_cov_4.937405_2_plen_52_part_00
MSGHSKATDGNPIFYVYQDLDRSDAHEAGQHTGYRADEPTRLDVQYRYIRV